MDIVERLRNGAMSTFVQQDAADEIERLNDLLGKANALARIRYEQLMLEQLRLQWIARQGSEYSQGIIIDMPGDGDWYVQGDKTSGQGRTFLEALDKAREVEK